MIIRKKINEFRIFRYVVLILLPLFVFQISCKKKATGSDDVELISFFPPPDGTAWLYQVDYDDAGINRFNMLATVIGEDDTTFPGESYTRVEMFDTTQADLKTGMILWLDASTPYRMGYKAAEMYFGFQNDKRSKEQGQVWDMKYVADITTYSIFSGTAGEQLQVTSTGNFYFSGDEVNGDPVTLVADVTVESLNATTTVPYGTVDNCIKIAGEGTETVAGQLYEFPIEIYLSQALGIVSLNISPGFSSVKLIDFYPVD